MSGKLTPITDPLTGMQFPGNVVPPSRLNQLGQGLLGIFPLPNAFDRSLTKGQYNYLFQESLTIPKWNHVFRVDLHRNDKDSLYVRGNVWYQNTKGYAVSAGGSSWGLYRGQYIYTDNGVGISHTHIFSSRVVNEFTAGMRHGVEKGPTLTQQDMDSMLRANRGLSGLGQFFPGNNPYGVIPQTSFGGVPSAAGVTYDTRFPLRGADTLFTLTDGLSIINGSHQFKVGFFADRARSYKGETGTYAGSFDFGRDVTNPFDTNYAYSNAVLGYFRSYTESNTRPTTEGRLWTSAWYVQDTWKVSRKLTLDYGVRFAWYKPPYQKNDRNLAAIFALTRYDPAVQPLLYRPIAVGGQRIGINPVTGDVVPAVLIGAYAPESGTPFQGMVTSTDPNYPSGFYEHPAPIPEPRIGFSYDPFGDGKTAIRGGFGTTHDTRSYLTLRLLTWNPPVQQNPVVYYGNMSSFLSSPTVLFPSNVSGTDLHNKTPGVYSWHFGVQREVGFGTVVDVSYVGNVGRHLPNSRNINTVPYGAHFLAQNADPTKPNTPLPDNFFRPYPGYGSITYYENASSSNYNGLEIAVNRRFSRSVQYGVSYTWSKAMDYVDSDTGTIAVYKSPRVWNYGKAGFDQTHNFSLNYTWDLPHASRLAPNPVVKALFDNWQLSGITRFVSGTPAGVGFSTTDGADIAGGGDGVRIVVTGKAGLSGGDRSFSKWFNTSVFARPAQGTSGNAPKDINRLPGINNWDTSIFKNVPLGKETRVLQLRWEVYNVFNHTQFSGVDSSARFDASGNQVNTQFGQVTSTRFSRVMQVALRLSF